MNPLFSTRVSCRRIAPGVHCGKSNSGRDRNRRVRRHRARIAAGPQRPHTAGAHREQCYKKSTRLEADRPESAVYSSSRRTVYIYLPRWRRKENNLRTQSSSFDIGAGDFRELSFMCPQNKSNVASKRLARLLRHKRQRPGKRRGRLRRRERVGERGLAEEAGGQSRRCQYRLQIHPQAPVRPA